VKREAKEVRRRHGGEGVLQRENSYGGEGDEGK